MSAKRLVPRCRAINWYGDDLGDVVTDSDAAKLEAVVLAAMELRKWGVVFDGRFDLVDVQVSKADIEAFDAALSALKEGQP